MRDSAASKSPELSLFLHLVFSTVWVLVREGETISACSIWACPTFALSELVQHWVLSLCLCYQHLS